MRASAKIFSLMPLILIGCAPGAGDDDSTQAKLQRNEEKLNAVYATVVGTYTGTVSVAERAVVLPATILMYTIKADDGVDSNGAPKSHTELRAQLRFDQVGEFDDHVFKVDFKERTGEVSFTQPSGSNGAANGGAAAAGTAAGAKEAQQLCPMGPKDPQLQIKGQLLGGRLRAELISAGRIGGLDLKRVSATSDVPLRDQKDRLERAFKKLNGTYTGSAGSANAPLKAQVVLRTENIAVSPGLKCPVLVGHFRYTKAIGHLNDTSFAVNFRESTGETLFTYMGNTAAGSCAVGPADNQVKIEGHLKGGSLTGAMSGASGDFGNVYLDRASAQTEIINDQAERINSAYAPLIGTYGGRFSGAGDGFPVKIVINVVSAPTTDNVACPVLNAQYLRPDMTIDPSIGMIIARADYYPKSDRIVFKSNMPPTNEGQPGHRDLNIDAQLSRDGFSGQMVWWNRSGTLDMKRCRGTTVTTQGRCAP